MGIRSDPCGIFVSSALYDPEGMVGEVSTLRETQGRRGINTLSRRQMPVGASDPSLVAP